MMNVYNLAGIIIMPLYAILLRILLIIVIILNGGLVLLTIGFIINEKYKDIKRILKNK
jgi:hypothetical protein